MIHKHTLVMALITIQGGIAARRRLGCIWRVISYARYWPNNYYL